MATMEKADVKATIADETHDAKRQKLMMSNGDSDTESAFRTKYCGNINCKSTQPLPITEFRKDNRVGREYQSYCKTCSNKSVRQYTNTDEGFMKRSLQSAEKCNDGRNKKGRNLQFTLTLDELKAKWETQQGRCHITAMPMVRKTHSDFKCSIERIDNDIGYTDENTVLVICEVNGAKQWTRAKAQYLFSTTVHDPIDLAAQLAAPKRTGALRGKQHKEWQVDTNGNIYCHHCDVTKPRTEFGSQIKRGCKTCLRVRNRARGRKYLDSWRASLLRIFYGAKGTAKRRGMTFELTLDEMINILVNQKGLCYYSGVPMSHLSGDYKMSPERLNVHDTYTVSNTVLICQEFNTFDQTRLKKAESNEGCSGWSRAKYAIVQEHFNSTFDTTVGN